MVVVFVTIALFWLRSESDPELVSQPVPESTEITAPEPEETSVVIGRSVEGRSIEAYTFGAGDIKLLFVGGVHGGYEWNSVALAYEFIEYFEQNEALLPDGITISIIPNLNPDAVSAVVGKDGPFEPAEVVASLEAQTAARMNANGVDLNRNFDCKWAPESTWRGKTVSAGTGPFSEPETAALRDYVAAFVPSAVTFWHSQANTVYASECEDGILPETLTLMNSYANVAGYNTQASFDAYSITGDAEGWLASIGIPAITVELSTHESLDWRQNLAGVNALINHYNSAKSD